MTAPVFLQLLDVLEIHEDLLSSFGGKTGVRDPGLLQSALAIPMSGSGETFFHADLYEMAAAYLFHLIKNHPFLDGNKRTALGCALVFLDLNGIEIGSNSTKSMKTKGPHSQNQRVATKRLNHFSRKIDLCIAPY